jgi:hypothetical protein
MVQPDRYPVWEPRNSEAMPESGSASSAHALMRAFATVICAMTLAGCGGPPYVQVASVVEGRKSAEPKSAMPRRLLARPTSRVEPRTANPSRLVEPTPATPIPLPAATLLARQPEPGCEATDANADERQRLDYERQCYRHAEMIVRARLELLQGSVDKTISAVRSGEASEP